MKKKIKKKSLDKKKKININYVHIHIARNYRQLRTGVSHLNRFIFSYIVYIQKNILTRASKKEKY